MISHNNAPLCDPLAALRLTRLLVYRAGGQTTQALQRLINRAVERGMRFRA